MRSLMLSVLLLAAAAPSWGSVLAQYIFTGADPVPISSTDPHLTAGGLSRNGITNTPADTLFFGGLDWPVNAFASSYFEMTLTPDPGFFIDFSGATLDYVVGSNPTFTTELRTSVDGFTSALASHVDPPGISNYSDPLAGLGVQSGPVTFRIYGQVDSNFGTSSLYNSSVSFFAPVGAVFASVPEPSSFGLALGGGLAILLRRRKKTR